MQTNWAAPFLAKHSAVSFMSERIEPQKFARFLAKIAHATAVADVEVPAFKPYLPELILTNRPRYIDLVGGSLSFFPIVPNQGVLVEIGPVKRELDGVVLVVAAIRLFASLGGPVYKVVVGEMLQKETGRPSPKNDGRV